MIPLSAVYQCVKERLGEKCPCARTIRRAVERLGIKPVQVVNMGKGHISLFDEGAVDTLVKELEGGGA